MSGNGKKAGEKKDNTPLTILCFTGVSVNTLLQALPSTAFPVLAAPVQERCSSEVLSISKSSQGAPCSARSQSTHCNLPWGLDMFAFRCYVWLEIFSGRANVHKEWKIIHVGLCGKGLVLADEAGIGTSLLGKGQPGGRGRNLLQSIDSLKSVLLCVRLGCGSAGTALSKREMSIPRHGG